MLPNIKKRLRQRPNYARTASGPAFLAYRHPPVIGSNNTKTAVTHLSSLTLPAVYACVQVITQDLASLPLNLVQVMPSGERRIAREHPLYKLFARSPDGGNNAPISFRMNSILHLMVWGNAYIEIVKMANGDIASLQMCDPDLTLPAFDEDGVIYYKVGGVIVPREKIIHFKTMSPNGLIGISPVLAARQSIALGLSALNFAGSFLSSSLAASGFLKTDASLTPEARKELAETLHASTSGANAFNLGVLPPGCEFEAFSIDPDKAMLIELQNEALLNCARVFNLPPHRIQYLQGTSYSSMEESNLAYTQSTLIPIAEIIEQSLALRLLTDDEVAEGYQFQHDYTKLMQGNSAARTAYYKALWSAGVISANQWAIAEGHPTFEGGDKHLVQLSYVESKDLPSKPNESE